MMNSEQNKQQEDQTNLESQDHWKQQDPANDVTHVVDDHSDDDGGGGMSLDVAGIHVNEKQLPHVGAFITALVLLVALTIGDRNADTYEYGVVVAAVTLFVGLVGAVYHFKWSKPAGEDTIGSALAYFLFAWTFVGACVLTFRGPFEITGNGYFASWGMVIAASMAVGISGGKAKEALTGFTGSIIGLAACAIVVICDVVDELDGSYKGESIYALIVSLLTIVVVSLFYYKQHTSFDSTDAVAFAVFAAFSVMWIILAFVTTFRGPFQLTGNGYFGAWAGAIVSVYAVKTSSHHD
mmetsp:Transcript_871/g.1800  ORF Transcript_871/g.1800 Transcript_871/m.1800 type:complete len:295 (+) Transcript_871:95-979(+)|eukprot:scaffold1982_cov93-Amphora_coffeaeformis.AAC.24